VHALVVVLRPVPWLTESPRQLVNDVAASAATPGLVFVCARRRVELQCVVAQYVSVLLALLVFRTLRRERFEA